MLRQVAPHLHTYQTDLRIGPGIVFPTRMTVVTLPDGLVLHSPLALDAEVTRAIEALGEVRWIVAPNDLHHMFVAGARERFPEADVLGTAGASAKHPDIDFDALLGDLVDAPPQAWDGALDIAGLDGTRRWHEFVFWVEADRTLLCSDLVFNMHEPANVWTDLLLRIIGARGTLAQSRTERWFLVRDRRAFAASIARILEWHFDRIVMAHGDIVETDGRRRLAEASRWAFDDVDLLPQLEQP